ncbi:MAG: 7TM-DISM domain-containing protein [bacterium]
MTQQHKRPLFTGHPAVFFICCFWCFCVCFFFPIVSIASDNPTYEQSYFIDKQFQFNIGSIDHAPFTAYSKHLNLGYQKTPVWVQIRITPSRAYSELAVPSELNNLILRVGPHDTNQIDMYEFDQGLWQVQTAGDLQSSKKNTCADDYYCFSLRNHSLEPRTVYLKIQTYGFLMPDTEVVTLENLSLASSARIKRIFISLTVTFFMLMIGLYWLTRHRSKLTIVFCIFQVCVVVYLLSIYGFPATWFPNLSVDVLDALPHVMFMLRTLLLNLVLFCRFRAVLFFHTLPTLGIFVSSRVCFEYMFIFFELPNNCHSVEFGNFYSTTEHTFVWIIKIQRNGQECQKFTKI